jgi:hypothetical protein
MVWGVCVCVCARLENFIEATGMDMIETDGPYEVCVRVRAFVCVCACVCGCGCGCGEKIVDTHTHT